MKLLVKILVVIVGYSFVLAFLGITVGLPAWVLYYIPTAVRLDCQRTANSDPKCILTEDYFFGFTNKTINLNGTSAYTQEHVSVGSKGLAHVSNPVYIGDKETLGYSTSILEGDGKAKAEKAVQEINAFFADKSQASIHMHQTEWLMYVLVLIMWGVALWVLIKPQTQKVEK